LTRDGGAALLGLALLSGCGSQTAPEPPAGPSRPFTLGFSDFPHAATEEGLAFAYQTIAREGDLAAWLFDDGVPWPEALAGLPYARGFMVGIERKLANTPAGHAVYLGINPINSARDGLAPYRGETGGQPLPAPWNARHLDDPAVIQAFVTHSDRMIAALRPQYFSYATEVNMLYQFNPAEWPAFIRFAAAVYPSLKQRHPGLPIFLTLQANVFHESRATQTLVAQQVLPYSDMVAVASYPFREFSDPASLPADHFGALRDLAPAKPFAVAETCWPAEDVGDPYPFPIASSEDAQRRYTERLLGDAERLQARFVSWTFSRDFDTLFTTITAPQERLVLRLFRDCGLLAGDGRARPAMGSWRDWLARRRASS